ncbi:MAG: hypothetical protein ACRCUT_09145, partial [Spirochaetota bacterium]
MKISGHGGISLSGPLSRNDRIMSLRTGDIVEVKVLERTGSRSAVLDIRGNRVLASFSAPFPDQPVLNLQVKKASSGQLLFEMKLPENPVSASLSAAMAGANPSPEKIRAFVLAARKDGSGLFSLMMALHGASSQRAKKIIRHAEKLNEKGFLKEGFHSFTGILAGFDDAKIRFLSEMVRPFRPDSSAGESDALPSFPDDPDAAAIIDEAVSAGKGDAACMIFPDAGQLTSLTAVSGNGYYAGTIESPVLGSVDFLVRGDCSMCSVILSGSASVCD